MSLNPRFNFLKQLFWDERKIIDKNQGDNILKNNKCREIQTKEKESNFSKTLRAEFHFLKFPFFDLCPRKSRRDEIEIKETEETMEEKIEILWRVSRNIKSNLPSSFARRIHKEVVEKILNSIKKPIHRLIKLGSLRQICKNMNISPSGGNCCEVKKALKDIASATIEARGTFRKKEENGAKKFFDGVFHLYDMLFFVGETLPDGKEADAVYILLNDMYVHNFNNNFVVPLDYQYYQSLQGDIASRMYEVLNIWFYPALEYKKEHIEKKYSELCSYFPLTRQNIKWRARQQLKSAHKQHMANGFLALNPEWKDTNEQSDWIIRYHIGPRAKEWYQHNNKHNNKLEYSDIKQIEESFPQGKKLIREEKDSKAVDDPLVTQLIQFGVTQKVAKELVEKNSKEVIEHWIRVIKYSKPKDKAAFLVSAIKEGWELPESIKKQIKNQKEKKQHKAKEQEKKQKSEQKKGYQEYLQKEIEDYKNSISKDQYQKELEDVKLQLFEKYPWIKNKHWDGPVMQSTLEADYKNWLIERNRINILKFEEWQSGANAPQ